MEADEKKNSFGKHTLSTDKQSDRVKKARQMV